jgi:hypothetical protein
VRYVAAVEVVGLAIALVALVVSLAALQRTRVIRRRAADTSPPHGPHRQTESAGAGHKRASSEYPGVHFELALVSETTYRLRNYGTHTAYGVKLKAHRLGKNASYNEFAAGHVEEHTLSPTDDHEKNVIELMWRTRRDESAPVQHKLLRISPPS